tara:strand:- start:12 stop:275 length:264 start_codon:yes stop_codon:yes gene_type:complete
LPLDAVGLNGQDGAHEPCSLDPKCSEDGAGDGIDVPDAINAVEQAGTLVVFSHGTGLLMVGGQTCTNGGLRVVSATNFDEIPARATR